MAIVDFVARTIISSNNSVTRKRALAATGRLFSAMVRFAKEASAVENV